MTDEKFDRVAGLIFNWGHQSKLPDYARRYPRKYMLWLLGLIENPYDPILIGGWESLICQIDNSLLDRLTGPHGLTVMRILMARKDLSDGT